MNCVIAITGGIGSGKSTVSNILSALGFPVYDCDRNAQKLIQNNNHIRQEILSEIHPEAYLQNGEYNRRLVAEVVFGNPVKLKTLNAIVHSAVQKDLELWIAMQSQDLIFFETAILYESQLDQIADSVWEVTAPEPLRIERVCRRSGLSPIQVQSRIKAQQKELNTSARLHSIILNDNRHSLLLQVHELLQKVFTEKFL